MRNLVPGRTPDVDWPGIVVEYPSSSNHEATVEVKIKKGKRRSGTDDPEARSVTIGPIHLWFSYDTCIAYKLHNGPLVVRKNDWGPTTERHIRNITSAPNSARLDGDLFELQMEEEAGRYFKPHDLDANCPAGIVADWLQDRGLDRAAQLVRETA